MVKYYDVTFHELGGKAVVKRQVMSERKPFEAWEDACEMVTEKVLTIRVNEATYVTLNRKFVVRIDAEVVDGPVDKKIKHRDELVNFVNTLSNMGI